MLSTIKRHQDRFAGGVLVAIGAAAMLIARTYPIGTLRQMGPGFFPLILATLLIIVGALVALNREASVPGATPIDALPLDTHEPDGLEHPEWRAWACIVAGIAAFILLAKPAGMLPATFAVVFISARGDRTATWRSSFILAAIIAIAGTALFHYGLQIQLAPIAGLEP